MAYIAPGKLMQDGFVKSFNDRMWDELLNEILFSGNRDRIHGYMTRTRNVRTWFWHTKRQHMRRC